MANVFHNCGVALSYDLSQLYNELGYSGHRGREACGIAAIGNDGIDVIKWLGTPQTFDLADMSRLLGYNKPYAFMGHVRYATRGGKGPEALLDAAHPHTLDGHVEIYGNHVIVRNATSAMVHNGQINAKYLDGIDKALLERCDTLGALDYMVRRGQHSFVENIPHAFTVIYADQRGIIAARDKRGVRSGFFGIDKNGKATIASENIVLQKTGARHITPMTRGNIYYFDRNGQMKELKTGLAEKTQPRHCSFEWLYISDTDSDWENLPVNGLREEMGVELAKEFPFSEKKSVIVTYAPRCAATAAYAYARELDYPFERIFYKLSHIRSFQGSNSHERKQSIGENLFRDKSKNVRGATVVIVDDSGVRGNVRSRLRELMSDSGAAETIYLCYTPIMCPIIDGVERGCDSGVDLPSDNPESNYISRVLEGSVWRNKAPEEFAHDDIPTFFLSLEGSHRAFERLGLSREDRCSYCYGGIGPED